MAEFPDHFSSRAALYASHRPHYPPALFEWLADNTPTRRRVWDCGTGSGQAALSLVPHFREVIATDASNSQLRHAHRSEQIQYAAMTAERTALRAGSMSLVTVAQALHWFDTPAFFAEVRRVLVPGGVIAVWSYGLLHVDPAINKLLESLYWQELASYWPAERNLVETGYASVAFPFEEVAVPLFTMEAEWTLEQLEGYLRTWSATARYQAATGRDPVRPFITAATKLWTSPCSSRRVRWPLVLRAGRI